MPSNTKYIGRGSKFGNPFRVVKMYSTMCPKGFWVINDLRPTKKQSDDALQQVYGYRTKIEAQKEAVNLYRAWSVNQDFSELANHDLACWCKKNEPCHGDVILERLNQ